MDSLFDLTFYTVTDYGYEQGSHIGLFASREEAEAVAVRYRKEVPGFKDYACDARIIQIPVVGDWEHNRKVYRFEGWNTNEDLDEVDIITSSCFVSREQAERELQAAKQRFPREEWVLNCHTIGQCDWQEGFVRCYPGGNE